jgi:hypothetical protein
MASLLHRKQEIFWFVDRRMKNLGNALLNFIYAGLIHLALPLASPASHCCSPAPVICL